MSIRTHRLVVSLRGVARRLGLNSVLGRLRRTRGYEDRFDAALARAIRPGDCVWDVGANVGLYASRFARAVGPNGTVVAFEPSPKNLLALHDAARAIANIQVVPAALGEHDGELSFVQGEDDLGATSRVSVGASTGVSVPVWSGAAAVGRGAIPKPTVVKIDTEGFELEVVRGLGSLLSDPLLRAIGIEVHFALLRERGMDDAPAAIERALASAGFRVSWPDASHLVALRR